MFWEESLKGSYSWFVGLNDVYEYTGVSDVISYCLSGCITSPMELGIHFAMTGWI